MEFNPNGSVKTITDATVAVTQAYSFVRDKALAFTKPVNPAGLSGVQAHVHFLKDSDVPEVVDALHEADRHLAMALEAYTKALSIVQERRREWAIDGKERHAAAMEKYADNKMTNKELYAFLASFK